MHVAPNQLVATYEPEGRPLGLITGDFVGEGETGFYLKHITVFPWAPKTTLARMIRELVEVDAPRFGVDFVLLYIKDGYLEGLDALARRAGFEPNEHREGGTWWRRDLRAPRPVS